MFCLKYMWWMFLWNRHYMTTKPVNKIAIVKRNILSTRHNVRVTRNGRIVLFPFERLYNVTVISNKNETCKYFDTFVYRVFLCCMIMKNRNYFATINFALNLFAFYYCNILYWFGISIICMFQRRLILWQDITLFTSHQTYWTIIMN